MAAAMSEVDGRRCCPSVRASTRGGGAVYAPRRISSRHVKRFGSGVAHSQEAFSQKPGRASENTVPSVTMASVQLFACRRSA
jgi:hypothetical protein